jgi:succinate dehydrogenase / fumarate reductase flavoprotein subunit
MTHPEEWAGTLVTEAVRGEGGHLKNADGERFMERYDAGRMELSTRDRVALANYSEIMEGRAGPNGGVFLDVTHLGKDKIMKQLPRMYRQLMESQLLDISQEPMEVAPTAHYSMGGVVVDAHSHQTSVQGLFAVGELTSGVHGANRLGGNSLAETLVFGELVGNEAAKYSANLSSQVRSRQKVEDGLAYLNAQMKPGNIFSKLLHRQLRIMMWECCGVVRSEDKLQEGLKRLEELAKRAEHIDIRPSEQGYEDLAHGIELKMALLSAKATLLGALARKESRGAHQRSDYPETDPKMLINFRVQGEGLNLSISEAAVKPIPDKLRQTIDELGDYKLEGRLLE